MDAHIQASLVTSHSTNYGEDYYEENLEHHRLIEVPSYGWDDGEFYLCPGYESYRNRQLYLHSYKFTREETLSEKLRTSLSKFKAAAWAAMVCNYRPVVVRKIKKKLHSTRHYLKSGAPLPLPLPKCLRVSS